MAKLWFFSFFFRVLVSFSGKIFAIKVSILLYTLYVIGYVISQMVKVEDTDGGQAKHAFE